MKFRIFLRKNLLPLPAQESLGFSTTWCFPQKSGNTILKKVQDFSSKVQDFCLKHDGVFCPKVRTQIQFFAELLLKTRWCFLSESLHSNPVFCGTFPKIEKSLTTLSRGRFFEQNDHLPFFYLFRFQPLPAKIQRNLSLEIGIYIFAILGVII